ncbi:uncharacterized protein LOC132713746 [Ruditapes philippinarum]|uniref:uncharacterized protein LOC132713746 n=1 Tax=Ruditapes philippinarum TaxID=129788 RepID=UPI00295B9981|nr:uncharacterized protein LOC132713746 [Ruditapes philippinarum]
MLPLDQEFRSEDSSSIENISVEECNNLCSSKNSCRVASMNEERFCYHYMGSELGIWRSAKITSGSQWFAKLQNYVYITSFPRAKYTNESFFGNIQYINTDSIITSPSYPFGPILDYDIQWIVNFEPGRFVSLVFTNLSLSEVLM